MNKNIVMTAEWFVAMVFVGFILVSMVSLPAKIVFVSLMMFSALKCNFYLRKLMPTSQKAKAEEKNEH